MGFRRCREIGFAIHRIQGDQNLVENDEVKNPAAELRGIQLFRKLSSPLMGED